jgi:hypothetical protein
MPRTGSRTRPTLRCPLPDEALRIVGSGERDDLIPHWIYEDSVRVERRVPTRPFSLEVTRFAWLKRRLAWALSRCDAKIANDLRRTDFQAAATTSRHVLIAAVRSVRCVLAEVRWRCTLKVLKTAAWVERNFWADRELLKPCILRSPCRVG